MPPKLYSSPVFGEDVWLVDDRAEYARIRLSGDERTIYLRSEFPAMKELEPATQRDIHALKKTFGVEVVETFPHTGPAPVKMFGIGDEKGDNRQHGKTRFAKGVSGRRGDDSGGTGSLFE